MTTSKTTAVENSEIVKNAAEAKYYEAEVALLDAQTINQTMSNTVDELAVVREKQKHLFESTNDFNSQHYVFDDEVSEHEVNLCKSTLRRMSRMYPGCPITIELNTPGGSIVDGFGLMDELERLKKAGHTITIRVQGQAASMGCVLLQVANRREIGANSFLMIHRAAFGAMGKSYEIEDEIEFVRKLEHRIGNVFATASGRPIEDFNEFFSKRKDMWFDAEEALANGLVDAIC